MKMSKIETLHGTVYGGKHSHKLEGSIHLDLYNVLSNLEIQ